MNDTKYFEVETLPSQDESSFQLRVTPKFSAIDTQDIRIFKKVHIYLLFFISFFFFFFRKIELNK